MFRQCPLDFTTIWNWSPLPLWVLGSNFLGMQTQPKDFGICCWTAVLPSLMSPRIAGTSTLSITQTLIVMTRYVVEHNFASNIR